VEILWETIKGEDKEREIKLRRKATLSAFLPKDGVTLSLSVTILFSCDSEFNSSTSMNVVIGSVWSSLMGSFTFSQIDISSSQDTLTAESLLLLDSVPSRVRSYCRSSFLVVMLLFKKKVLIFDWDESDDSITG
jgi:hypothetical protein